MSIKRIKLERINDVVNFKASNEDGQSILLDGSPSLGGIGNGVRPMETLLMSLAACSAIDIVMILKKMRQNLEDIKIDVEAQSDKVNDYSQYSKIHLSFYLFGDLKEAKVSHAVTASMEKYCSVAKTLEKTSIITFDYNINPE